jgi:subtilisin
MTASYLSSPEHALSSLPEGAKIPNQFIVVLKNTASMELPYYVANNVAASTGAQVLDVYDSTAIKGFTTVVPNQQALDVILNDPSTAYVEQDQVVHAAQTLQQELYPLQMYPHQNQIQIQQQAEIFSQLLPQQNQIVPTGVKRVLQPSSSSLSQAGSAINYGTINNGKDDINVDIAILDTGIDLDHPDLNIYNEVTFVSGTSTADDDNGHGTHVAGIAAAKNNGFGTVGMAPGARLWAVKVLNSQGIGLLSDIIKGIDYVAEHATEIDVVNMSFGCDHCISIALENAIQNAASSGSVTFVTAAGNSGIDASGSSLTRSRYVLPISAIVDTDGSCGGLGPPSRFGADDTFASFSNYGPTIAMAAPGVEIYSTFKDGGYAAMSGTSMSAAHVTGAAGLIKGLFFPTATSSQLKNIILDMSSAPQNVRCESNNFGQESTSMVAQASLTNAVNNNARGYFGNDPDGINEPLLFVDVSNSDVNVPPTNDRVPPYQQVIGSLPIPIPQPLPTPPSPSFGSQMPEYNDPNNPTFQLDLPALPQQDPASVYYQSSSDNFPAATSSSLPSTYNNTPPPPPPISNPQLPQSLSSFPQSQSLLSPTISQISRDTVSSASSSSLPSSVLSDIAPPETFISSATTVSNNSTSDNSAIQNNTTTRVNGIAFTFAGRDDTAISGFECRIGSDNERTPYNSQQQQELKPFSCANKVIVNNLLVGNHTFQVTALDSSGNRDHSPAVFGWNVMTPSNNNSNNISNNSSYNSSNNNSSRTVITGPDIDMYTMDMNRT